MEKYDIVIADDEAFVMEILAKQLNQADGPFHVVGKAENGKQALELVKELKPDILLTDICMPIMDGLELSICLAAEANFRKQCIVMESIISSKIKNTQRLLMKTS